MMFYQSLDNIPELTALHAAECAHFPYLLSSTGQQGWDILFALPQQQTLYFAGEEAQFFADLAALKTDAPPIECPFPFSGGWFVFLAYELLSAIEPTVPVGLDHSFPLAALTRVPAAVLVNRGTQQAYLMAEDKELGADLSRRLSQTPPLSVHPPTIEVLHADAPQHYIDAIHRLKRYIAAGDVFQVNISRAWHATLSPPSRAIDIFCALRQANPAPFSACIKLNQECSIISSSPERLVSARNGWVETRPIAGTIRRSTQAKEDEQLKRQLLLHPKERAEHTMLVDLARNDVGRLCQPGTVEVNELMALASYAYVHHIESNVRGLLHREITPFDILRAVFPGGTISGCPKVRAMQLIRELEEAPRRAYTGSLGYINHDGSLDFNILIRTFMLQQHTLWFRSGGGIVADSDPDYEVLETQHKAHGLLKALSVRGEWYNRAF